MSMISDLEQWNDPNQVSRIYQQLENWEMRHDEKAEKLRKVLERDIEEAIAGANLPVALMLLNKLELEFDGAKTRQLEFENALKEVYHKRLSSAGNPSCYLFDYELPKINGDIRQFRNRHRDERCFILGTGPSLDRIDLSALKDEVTFGSNLLFRNFKNMGFETTYYTAEDYFLFKNHAEEMAAIKNSIKFIPAYRAKMSIHSPNTIYMNLIPDNNPYPGFPFFSTDAATRVWSASNSLYICLQLANYMGFAETYLLGVDHNYEFPASAKFMGNDMILYGPDASHCAAAQFGHRERFHAPVPKRSEKAYARAKRAFELNGRKIYNLTEGSQLDIFEKKKLEEILMQPKAVGQAYEPEYDVTIIIPAYNAVDTLAECVDSAMNQQCSCEIIIIDDGSTDNTADLAREFTDRFDFIKLVRQENKGLGGARNTGLDLARGKFITFLDSDDTLVPHVIGKALRKIEQEGADILLFDYNHIINGKNEQRPLGYYIDETGPNALQQFMLSHILAATARLYRLEFLRKHKLRFPEHLFHEDILFTISAYYFAKKATFLRQKGYNWISRPGSITRHIREKHIDSMSRQIEAVKNFMVEQGEYERLAGKFVIFCYRLAKILLNRIREVKDPEAYNKLTTRFMEFLEKHELDDFDNISTGNAFMEDFALDIVNSIYKPLDKPLYDFGLGERVPSFPESANINPQ